MVEVNPNPNPFTVHSIFDYNCGIQTMKILSRFLSVDCIQTIYSFSGTIQVETHFSKGKCMQPFNIIFYVYFNVRLLGHDVCVCMHV